MVQSNKEEVSVSKNINPYRELGEKEFKEMEIKSGFVIVKALMQDDLTDLSIVLKENNNYKMALCHEIVKMGESCFGDEPETRRPKVGSKVMIVGNCLDAVADGKFSFIRDDDVYCWW